VARSAAGSSTLRREQCDDIGLFGVRQRFWIVVPAT
jgi:hypothetical protein